MKVFHIVPENLIFSSKLPGTIVGKVVWLGINSSKKVCLWIWQWRLISPEGGSPSYKKINNLNPLEKSPDCLFLGLK